jgi:DNA replication protein DnaC
MGMMYWLEEPREMEEADFRQMDLPERYRSAVWKKVPKGEGRDLAWQYAENIREMRETGMGLYIFGPNGHGKTALATLLMRRFRSHGQTCLFIRHSKLPRAAIKGVQVGTGRDLWAYARQADVLVIDDFAKDHKSDGGFDANELEDLLRDRYDKCLVTLFTSNVPAGRLAEAQVRESTVSVIQGMVIPVILKGKESQRTAEAKQVFTELWESENG